jgi:D-glycerate 3-kinase
VSDYRDILADIAAVRLRRSGMPIVLGICGSQGSGKSTMAQALKAALQEAQGLTVAVLSLDDLYLSLGERTRLAREVHPLLQTRGVPGTHDVDLGIEVIQRLLCATPEELTRIPRFDKARDDRHGPKNWGVFQGRADVVIFEGWCVGAVSQQSSALPAPVNALEREFDPDGRWRRYVNDQLAGPYRALFGLLDCLVMLCAPGFEVVFEWRREQERRLEESVKVTGNSAVTRVMNDEELRRFIAHYERLTRHILSEMPERADIVMDLDDGRRVVAITRRES